MRLTLRHRAIVLLVSCLSVGGSLGLTATRLEFSTDRTQLLDPEHPIQKGYRAFREEFGGNTDLVILISGQPARVRAAVDHLGIALSQDPTFTDVLYRLDMPELTRHSLYFLSLSELRQLRKQARALQVWWPTGQGASPDLLGALDGKSEEQLLALIKPFATIAANAAEGALASLKARGEGAYISPIPAFVSDSERLAGTAFEPGQSVFYNTVGDQGACMVIARPSDPSGSFSTDSATISRLRAIAGRVGLDHPTVNIVVSGEPVINTDEMVGARNDAIKCSLTALVLVCIFLAMAFGELVLPFCAALSLLVGLFWSFAFAALTVGTLNLLTVHFATILVGLGMTFAIQLLSHYQELRSQATREAPAADALERAVTETGLQTTIGAVATAVAFWSLHFAGFRAAGELGLITGSGVLLTFLSIWTVFPVLVYATQGRRPVRSPRIPGFAFLGAKLEERPSWVLAGSLAITLYSATWINRVPFDYDLLSLQAKGSDSVLVEHLLQNLGYSSLYAVVTADSLAQAEALTRQLQRKSAVSHVESVVSLMPQEVSKKRPIVEDILRSVGRFRQVSLPHLDGFMASGQSFRDANQLLRLRDHFLEDSEKLHRAVARLPASRDRQRLTTSLWLLDLVLRNGSPGPLEAGLRFYETHVYEEVERYRDFLLQQLPTPPDILAALPPALRSRSVSARGRFSLRIFPRVDVWQREALEKFVHQLEDAAPGVTGTPLLIFYYLEELRLAYSSAGTNALLVIAVLLLIHYRSPVQAALALFPKLLGVVWMIGVMGVCGVSFNAANFLALPITLGIGLVFGVNILTQCRHGGVAGLYASATGRGVLLSGLVATLGFASFALANHVGVASFGFVMAAGVATNMVTSLATLPALLAWWAKRQPGISLTNLENL